MEAVSAKAKGEIEDSGKDGTLSSSASQTVLPCPVRSAPRPPTLHARCFSSSACRLALSSGICSETAWARQNTHTCNPQMQPRAHASKPPSQAMLSKFHSGNGRWKLDFAKKGRILKLLSGA
eukprot:1789296-Rhodomonas_salina.2